MTQLQLIPKLWQFRIVFWNPKIEKVKYLDFHAVNIPSAVEFEARYMRAYACQPLVLKESPYANG